MPSEVRRAARKRAEARAREEAARREAAAAEAAAQEAKEACEAREAAREAARERAATAVLFDAASAEDFSNVVIGHALRVMDVMPLLVEPTGVKYKVQLTHEEATKIRGAWPEYAELLRSLDSFELCTLHL